MTMTQDLDGICHLGHDRQIMGDIDRRGIKLFHDIPDGRQNLNLCCDIQGRCRFIKHDQIGATGHRHGRHGAL